MTVSFFRLGLLALFSALLMLSGCNSSGSDDGDRIAEQPAIRPPSRNRSQPDPGPEARDTVLTPAAELVPVILVDRLANQSGQLDADIRERLFKTEPVNELAVHRVQMYCLSRLYQTELAINDALLGWRNAYPAGTDPVTWLERAAEEELVRCWRITASTFTPPPCVPWIPKRILNARRSPPTTPCPSRKPTTPR